MNFEKYESIPNLNTEKCLKNYEKFIEGDKNIDTIWVMSEKIHGCNFSFLVNSQCQIQCARRQDKLGKDENFYNFQQVLSKYEKNIQKIYKICEKKFQNLVQIQVYGELCGGVYEHLEINAEEDQDSKRCQKEVQYCPQNEFFAFDLKIYEKNSQNGKFVDFKTSLQIFEESQIRYVKPLKLGKYEDLILFDVESFQSQIYKEFNLPQLQENIAEGVVLRPYEVGHEPLIKKKSQKFWEKVKESSVKVPKINETRNGVQNNKNNNNNFVFCTQNEKNQIIQFEKNLKKIECFVCENRLINMLSKQSQEKAFSQLHLFYKQFSYDALNDFQQENQQNEKWYNSLSSGDQQKVEDCLIKQAKIVIKEYRSQHEINLQENSKKKSKNSNKPSKNKKKKK